MKEILSSFRENSISLHERQQTPAPETDPEHEIKNYPRLLQLARAGLVPEDLVWKMTNVLKDPKRFGVSPQVRDKLYDVMIKTLNYIVVSDPATFARFRTFLMDEEKQAENTILQDFKSLLKETRKNIISKEK